MRAVGVGGNHRGGGRLLGRRSSIGHLGSSEVFVPLLHASRVEADADGRRRVSASGASGLAAAAAIVLVER